MLLVKKKEKMQAIQKIWRKQIRSLSTRNRQYVKLNFVKKTQKFLMDTVPPRNLSSDLMKRWLLMSDHAFSLPLLTSEEVLKWGCHLMWVFAGLFSSPCCTLSHDPGQSIDSSRGYVPHQYGCELIYFMLNAEVKN